MSTLPVLAHRSLTAFEPDASRGAPMGLRQHARTADGRDALGAEPAAEAGTHAGSCDVQCLSMPSAPGVRVCLLATGAERQQRLLAPLLAAGLGCEPSDGGLVGVHAVSTPAEIQAFTEALVSARFDVLLIDGELPAPRVAAVLHALQVNQPRELTVMMILPGEWPSAQIARLLQAGADDYVSWPAAPVLLRAKFDSILRRSQRQTAMRACEVHGEYSFDLALNEVSVQRLRVHLTPKEFRVALLLFRHHAQPLSREFLRRHVWSDEGTPSPRTIDTHVSVVRSKLQLRPENGYRLKTVYGFGYRLERVSAAERQALAREMPAARLAQA